MGCAVPSAHRRVWQIHSKGLCVYTSTLRIDLLFFPFRLEQLLHTSHTRLLYFGALARSGKELIVKSEFFAAYNMHQVQNIKNKVASSNNPSV